MKLLISASLCLPLLLPLSCKNKDENKVLTKEIVFKKEGEVSIFKTNTDSLITKLDIEIAETEYETQTGLMYRKTLENKQGMLFIFNDSQPRSFYMKNTEFSLDIIYIDASYTIVSIQENAQPFNTSSLPSEKPAKYVLEIKGGLCQQLNIEKGDKINFVRL